MRGNQGLEVLPWRVLEDPCCYIPRHTATYAQTTEQHVEQAASTLHVGLVTFLGFDDASVPQGIHEQS
jgi:phage gp36-like protein